VGKRAQRHVYVLTCYFDINALVEVVATIFKRINSVSGKIAGVTVAIDVGEWIRCRVSSDELIDRIAKAARLPEKLAKVISVRVPGHLLHAKAYAAIKPLGQEEGFVVITSGNTTQRGLGLSDASNLEIAALITEPESLAEFEGIMRELAKHQISERLAMKQDAFLQALALFKADSGHIEA
jgi:PLD-like domain